MICRVKTPPESSLSKLLPFLHRREHLAILPRHELLLTKSGLSYLARWAACPRFVCGWISQTLRALGRETKIAVKGLGLFSACPRSSGRASPGAWGEASLGETSDKRGMELSSQASRAGGRPFARVPVAKGKILLLQSICGELCGPWAPAA